MNTLQEKIQSASEVVQSLLQQMNRSCERFPYGRNNTGACYSTSDTNNTKIQSNDKSLNQKETSEQHLKDNLSITSAVSNFNSPFSINHYRNRANANFIAVNHNLNSMLNESMMSIDNICNKVNSCLKEIDRNWILNKESGSTLTDSTSKSHGDIQEERISEKVREKNLIIQKQEVLSRLVKAPLKAKDKLIKRHQSRRQKEHLVLQVGELSELDREPGRLFRGENRPDVTDNLIINQVTEERERLKKELAEEEIEIGEVEATVEKTDTENEETTEEINEKKKSSNGERREERQIARSKSMNTKEQGTSNSVNATVETEKHMEEITSGNDVNWKKYDEEFDKNVCKDDNITNQDLSDTSKEEYIKDVIVMSESEEEMEMAMMESSSRNDSFSSLKEEKFPNILDSVAEERSSSGKNLDTKVEDDEKCEVTFKSNIEPTSSGEVLRREDEEEEEIQSISSGSRIEITIGDEKVEPPNELERCLRVINAKASDYIKHFQKDKTPLKKLPVPVFEKEETQTADTSADQTSVEEIKKRLSVGTLQIQEELWNKKMENTKSPEYLTMEKFISSETTTKITDLDEMLEKRGIVTKPSLVDQQEGDKNSLEITNDQSTGPHRSSILNILQKLQDLVKEMKIEEPQDYTIDILKGDFNVKTMRMVVKCRRRKGLLILNEDIDEKLLESSSSTMIPRQRILPIREIPVVPDVHRKRAFCDLHEKMQNQIDTTDSFLAFLKLMQKTEGGICGKKQGDVTRQNEIMRRPLEEFKRSTALDARNSVYEFSKKFVNSLWFSPRDFKLKRDSSYTKPYRLESFCRYLASGGGSCDSRSLISRDSRDSRDEKKRKFICRRRDRCDDTQCTCDLRVRNVVPTHINASSRCRLHWMKAKLEQTGANMRKFRQQDVQFLDTLDDLCITDLAPFNAEYPRKDDIRTLEDAGVKQVQKSFLYKMLYPKKKDDNVWYEFLSPQLMCGSKNCETCRPFRKKNESGPTLLTDSSASAANKSIPKTPEEDTTDISIGKPSSRKRKRNVEKKQSKATDAKKTPEETSRKSAGRPERVKTPEKREVTPVKTRIETAREEIEAACQPLFKMRTKNNKSINSIACDKKPEKETFKYNYEELIDNADQNRKINKKLVQYMFDPESKVFQTMTIMPVKVFYDNDAYAKYRSLFERAEIPKTETACGSGELAPRDLEPPGEPTHEEHQKYIAATKAVDDNKKQKCCKHLQRFQQIDDARATNRYNPQFVRSKLFRHYMSTEEKKFWASKYGKTPSQRLIQFIENQPLQPMPSDGSTPSRKSSINAPSSQEITVVHSKSLNKSFVKGRPLANMSRQDKQRLMINHLHQIKNHNINLHENIQRAVNVIESRMVDILSTADSRKNAEAFNEMEKEITTVLEMMRNEEILNKQICEAQMLLSGNVRTESHKKNAALVSTELLMKKLNSIEDMEAVESNKSGEDKDANKVGKPEHQQKEGQPAEEHKRYEKPRKLCQMHLEMLKRMQSQGSTSSDLTNSSSPNIESTTSGTSEPNKKIGLSKKPSLPSIYQETVSENSKTVASGKPEGVSSTGDTSSSKKRTVSFSNETSSGEAAKSGHGNFSTTASTTNKDSTITSSTFSKLTEETSSIKETDDRTSFEIAVKMQGNPNNIEKNKSQKSLKESQEKKEELPKVEKKQTRSETKVIGKTEQTMTPIKQTRNVKTYFTPDSLKRKEVKNITSKSKAIPTKTETKSSHKNLEQKVKMNRTAEIRKKSSELTSGGKKCTSLINASSKEINLNVLKTESIKIKKEEKTTNLAAVHANQRGDGETGGGKKKTLEKSPTETLLPPSPFKKGSSSESLEEALEIRSRLLSNKRLREVQDETRSEIFLTPFMKAMKRCRNRPKTMWAKDLPNRVNTSYSQIIQFLDTLSNISREIESESAHRVNKDGKRRKTDTHKKKKNIIAHGSSQSEGQVRSYGSSSSFIDLNVDGTLEEKIRIKILELKPTTEKLEKTEEVEANDQSQQTNATNVVSCHRSSLTTTPFNDKIMVLKPPSPKVVTSERSTRNVLDLQDNTELNADLPDLLKQDGDISNNLSDDIKASEDNIQTGIENTSMDDKQLTSINEPTKAITENNVVPPTTIELLNDGSIVTDNSVSVDNSVITNQSIVTPYSTLNTNSAATGLIENDTVDRNSIISGSSAISDHIPIDSNNAICDGSAITGRSADSASTGHSMLTGISTPTGDAIMLTDDSMLTGNSNLTSGDESLITANTTLSGNESMYTSNQSLDSPAQTRISVTTNIIGGMELNSRYSTPRNTSRPITPRPLNPRPITPRPVTPRPITPRPMTPRTETSRHVTNAESSRVVEQKVADQGDQEDWMLKAIELNKMAENMLSNISEMEKEEYYAYTVNDSAQAIHEQELEVDLPRTVEIVATQKKQHVFFLKSFYTIFFSCIFIALRYLDYAC